MSNCHDGKSAERPGPDQVLIDKPRTSGEWATEPEAWAAFDAVVAKSGAFRSYSEVEGEYIQPRPLTRPLAGDKGARIDRILIPLQRAVDAGWKAGAIGVEGKRSGTKIGPLISQGLDYTRVVWRLDEERHKPGPPGMLLMTEWVFIFPLENPKGDVESIMANNRVGNAWLSQGELRFSCGVPFGIIIQADGSVIARRLPMGHKRGSR